MIVGYNPWEKLRDNKAIVSIVEDEINFDVLQINEPFLKIITNCMTKNKELRWTAEQV